MQQLGAGTIRSMLRSGLIVVVVVGIGQLIEGPRVALGAAHDHSKPWPVDADTGQAVAGNPIALNSRYPNIRIWPSDSIDQCEMSIAVDPTDPNHIIVGANTVVPRASGGWRFTQGSYHSFDGGLSWVGNNTNPDSTYFLSGLFDPVVTFDGDGRAFRAHIESFYAPIHEGRAYLFDLAAGDTIWELLDIVPNDPEPDKPHLAFDYSDSTNRGTLYYAYTYLPSDSTETAYGDIRMCVLAPGDSILSDTMTLIGSEFGNMVQGANLIVSPWGEVYIACSRYNVLPRNQGKEVAIGFASLEPGAQTFTVGIDSIHGLGVEGIRTTALKNSPYDTRANSFPTMGLDTSGGQFNQSLYIAWADRRNGNSDIMLTSRRNSDSDWSAPIRVDNDATSKDQWMPWLAVDPSGRVHVVFYDSRIDLDGNVESAVTVATSCDGGQNFANYIVSDSSFSPSEIEGAQAGFAGDYIGIAANDCLVFPCWNDNRTGRHQAYIARIPTNQVWQDSTLSADISLDRDLWIAPGATLTIDAGTMVTMVPECDNCALGSDDQTSEIIVEGTLVIDGDPNNPVVLQSTGGEVGDWYGIRVIDSGQVFIRNATIKNALTAISLESPSVASVIDSCVIEDCFVGIRVDDGTPAMTIRGVDIVNCSQTGLYLEDSVRIVDATITGSLTGYGAHLLDCRVVIDSSVVPTRGIECNIESGDVVWDSTNILLQNVSVGSSSSLTVNPGSRVLASDGYALKAYGEVSAIGTESDSVRFGSKLANPGRQDWAGIWHFGPGDLTLEHAVISDGYRGLWVLDVSSTDLISVNSCEFRHGFYAGIQNDRDTSTHVLISDTRFVDITNHGVYIYKGRTEIDGCHFREGMVYGVRFEDGASATRPSAGFVRNCDFDSLTTGSASGVYLGMLNLHTGTPILESNSFGPHWLGGAPNTQTAIFVYNCTDVLTLQGNRIDGDDSGGFKPAYGVLNYSTTSYIRDDYANTGPTIDDAKHGVYCFSTSAGDADYARVRSTKFESCKYGVYLYSNSKADLKHTDSGNAFIGFCEDSGLYAVYNANSSFTVPAKYNYWDSTGGCTASWPYVHPNDKVDFDSALATDPFSGGGGKRVVPLIVHQEPQAAAHPEAFIAEGNYPNPFNSSTVIQFTLDSPGKVELVIYNILGQRIRHLLNEERPVGQHRIAWDGKDQTGREVASGMYFYRLNTPSNQFSRKMVVVK